MTHVDTLTTTFSVDGELISTKTHLIIMTLCIWTKIIINKNPPAQQKAVVSVCLHTRPYKYHQFVYMIMLFVYIYVSAIGFDISQSTLQLLYARFSICGQFNLKLLILPRAGYIFVVLQFFLVSDSQSMHSCRLCCFFVYLMT